MSVKFKVKRYKKYDTKAEITASVAQAQYNLARAVKKNIKARTPVDTGNMKGSVDIMKMPNGSWSVYVGAYYGIYVEYGHRVHTNQGVRWVPAQPFFRPGIKDGIAEWKGRGYAS